MLTAGCINFGEGRLAARVGALGQCAALLESFDRSVDRAGGPATEARRVPGFPYLRVDRALARLAARPLTDREYEEWVAAMAKLDRDARGLELARVPAARAEEIECAERVLAADLGSPRTRTLLLERVRALDAAWN